LNEKVGNIDKGGKVASPRNATIVLDPPRSGAGGKVVGQLLAISPKHIIYVACDPVALARDLKPLIEGGYELKQLRAFDLFPHTHHVEAVASLVRK
jgi:tRNA/tmRNA/rRNA uracil-C5-methylase (TrmA/RlmC/RlmD family)